MNPDFEEFKRDVSWFIDRKKQVEIITENSPFQLSLEFANTFPKLTRLLKIARVVEINMNNDSFKLASWTNKNQQPFGWLIKKEQQGELPLIPNHRLLLEEMGGIIERYNEPENSWSNNHEFMFLESGCALGINDWDEYYEGCCKFEDLEPIDYKGFISFAQEANGNITLYNPINKAVMLFATDHSFDNVEFVKDQPEYTFHTINEVAEFKDYVELLAHEWLENIIYTQ
ncbi:MAG: hypothetical protein KDE26_26825 [Bacteroidetes bacterium]|nr:hypothetical protein [Bacteroidota bacterium]MCB0846904.1 hypothetical protein [Bacteroidota bacterium]